VPASSAWSPIAVLPPPPLVLLIRASLADRGIAAVGGVAHQRMMTDGDVEVYLSCCS